MCFIMVTEIPFYANSSTDTQLNRFKPGKNLNNTSRVEKSETEKWDGFCCLDSFSFHFTVLYAEFPELLEVWMPLPGEEAPAEA